MNVLVTGASGFIGGRVMEDCKLEGWSVVGTSLSARQGLIGVDIADPSSIASLTSSGPFDAVVHCAGIAHRVRDVAETDYRRINVEGTRNIARFAAVIGAKQFVLLSSVLVYGRHGVGIGEDEKCNPRDVYASSKLNGEIAAAEVCSETGMSLTILRPAPVIGEGCKGNFAKLIRAIDRGRFINVGNGANHKSMIYVGDVAAAAVSSLRSSRNGVERFNLAAGPVSTGELLDLIYGALGKRSKKLSLPSRPIRIALNSLAQFTSFPSLLSAANSLETWTSDAVYSSESIKVQRGFEPQTDLTEAVRRTVAHYRANRTG